MRGAWLGLAVVATAAFAVACGGDDDDGNGGRPDARVVDAIDASSTIPDAASAADAAVPDAGSPDAAAPAASCAEAFARGETTDGTYTLDLDGDGPEPPIQTACDMTTDGGGWTLVLVSSDDGTATWTMNARALMTTDTTLVGSAADPTRDFKSAAYHAIAFTDVMFRHAPSGEFASYHDVGDGTVDIGTFIDGIAYPNCDAASGFAMTAGTISVAGQLCDTNLYFNAGDYDGIGEAYCLNLSSDANTATFGPAWSATFNGGCPFDDPERTGLGPANECPNVNCAGNATAEKRGVGFGDALSLNTGEVGMAQNYMQMYVR